MSLYDNEPWAKLVTQMGMIPEETEAQARRVAAFAAEYIRELEEKIEDINEGIWTKEMMEATYG